MHTTTLALQYYHKNDKHPHASDIIGPSSGAWTPPTGQQAAPPTFVQFYLLHTFYTKNFQQLFYMQKTNIFSNCLIQLLYSLMWDQ